MDAAAVIEGTEKWARIVALGSIRFLASRNAASVSFLELVLRRKALSLCRLPTSSVPQRQDLGRW